MSGTIDHTAKLLCDIKSELGEGPVWDHREKLLRWVDIEGGKLHSHDPLTGSIQSLAFGEMLGAAVPTEKGNLLLALESGLAIYNPRRSSLKRCHSLDETGPEIRCNDGKCDPGGNFWIGTMHKDLVPGAGGLYRVCSRFRTTLQIPGTTVSNGMAWSADNTKFFYIDSTAYEVWVYDFNPETCAISNKETLFPIPRDYGSPDGMCIDDEGMLWIAHWGGNCVRRWDPADGSVLRRIGVDAPQVTSCCFGGENMDTLYITSARSGLPGGSLLKYPLSGCLFSCKPGVRGTRINYFKEI